MGSAIIRFRSQSSNGAAGLWNIGAVPRTASTGADFVFQSRNTSGNYNESIRLDPDGGIKFNGDTAAANNLDDYEEGTWTPTIREILGMAKKVTFSFQCWFLYKNRRLCYVWDHLIFKCSY